MRSIEKVFRVSVLVSSLHGEMWVRPLRLRRSFWSKEGPKEVDGRQHVWYSIGGESLIIAVDFDGVLVEDKFPDIGKEDAEMVSLVRELIEKPGIEVILWTSRVAEPLEHAIDWCIQHELFFDAINENAPSNRKKYEKIYPMGTRKVYANYYLDDHNLGYNRQQAVEIIKSILKEEK